MRRPANTRVTAVSSRPRIIVSVNASHSNLPAGAGCVRTCRATDYGGRTRWSAGVRVRIATPG